VERERPELEGTIERLADRLAAVERRLAVLEGSASAPPEPVSTRRAAGAAAEKTESRSTGAEAVALLGRTLVVLGGAFALRAITEAGILNQTTGAAIGMAYAVVWIMLADRSAAVDRRQSAFFHGLTATVIAYPLLWEAIVRFRFLSPVAGAVAMTVLTGVTIFVTARRDLRRLAWGVALVAAGTALTLAVATKMLVVFAGFLLLLGFATLWLGYLKDWHDLGWTLAGLVDVCVLGMTAIALIGDPDQVERILRPASLVVLQLSLVVAYFGAFFYRTLARSEELAIAEIVQGIAAVLIGLGGAIAVTHTMGLPGDVLGAVSLVTAAGCYAASFAFIDRRLERRVSFIFYTSLALVFALVGFGWLLDAAGLSLVLSAAAVLAAWLGAFKSRATLSLHGAVYAVAAAITSGLVASSVDALAAPGVPAGGITASGAIALAVLGVCVALPVATHGKTWGRFSRYPKLVLLAFFLLGAGGVVVGLGARFLPVAEGKGPEPGALADLRTGVLSVAALLLAWLGRWRAMPEAIWLVYAVLGLGGLKLLLEDLRAGRAATLFVSLALYGGALILAPRLARRRKSGPSSPG
jgi:hypothetical protein